MDIQTFRAELQNDIQLRLQLDGGFSDWAFAAIAANRLEEASEISNFEPCHFRTMTGNIAVDGYSVDDADDSLRVFIVHRSEQDDLSTLTKTEAKSIFAKVTAFVAGSIRKKLDAVLDENHPARDLAELLYERRTKLSRVRAYILTDALLSTRIKDWPEGNIDGIPADFHIWDVGRFYRAHIAASGLDEIVVDFTEGINAGVPCLQASTINSPYNGYLCALPADLLARIYDEYGSRLLEGNVRAFLSSKGKVNKGILRTLIESPEMFFAYNNGISAVASSVVIAQTVSGPRLISATDLQIVNGGQTTASIESAHRIERATRLEQTFVPMKLSVLKENDPEAGTVMVGNISKFANSQNKVSDADFFSNHPFHRRLEQISRRLLAPAKLGLQHETRWYYERARGQYLNEFARLTLAQGERMKLILPKSQIITKTDLGRSELSFAERPHIVSQGAQSVALDFAARIAPAWKADSDSFNEEYFRSVVARTIFYRAAERIVGAQSWYVVGYKSIIVSYTVAKISFDIERLKGGVLDLRSIWKAQMISSASEEQIVTTARLVFSELNNLPSTQHNISQWAKRALCTDQIKRLPISMNAAFTAELIGAVDAYEGSRAAKALQQMDSGIDVQSMILSVGAPFWRALLNWALSRGNLTPVDQKALEIASSGTAVPNERQSKRLLRLKDVLEGQGFIYRE